MSRVVSPQKKVLPTPAIAPKPVKAPPAAALNFMPRDLGLRPGGIRRFFE